MAKEGGAHRGRGTAGPAEAHLQPPVLGTLSGCFSVAPDRLRWQKGGERYFEGLGMTADVQNGLSTDMVVRSPPGVYSTSVPHQGGLLQPLSLSVPPFAFHPQKSSIVPASV